MDYSYLKSISAPRHMVIAAGYMGIKEVPGVGKSNPLILKWAENLGLSSVYKDDDTAWCALFFAEVMKEAGREIKLPGNDKYNYLRALKYVDANMLVVDKKDAKFGDALIFQRPEGGHIGFYVAEDKDAYHVLGGNTGNMVQPTRILKSRLVAVRRPLYVSYAPEKLFVSAEGKISTNEA